MKAGRMLAVLRAEVKPQVWVTTRLRCPGSRRREVVRNSAMRNSVHEKMKQRTAVAAMPAFTSGM